MRAWVDEAIAKIEADLHRSSDTHLIHVPLPATPQIQLYLKDESTHITGSLKHRLARSLFLYALCNGWLGPDTPIIEASSGSTAISEAYFARLIGLRFITVIARSTSPEKIARIQRYGGECVFVDDPAQDRVVARQLARELGGHFMDQFTYAERATDWRGNNNIAESIFEQMAREPHPVPRWIVCGAGTGGTSATIGRYIRYRRYATQLCVVDPLNSVYYRYWQTRDATLTCCGASGVEGIGRPQVEPSFVPDVVDRMLQVPNAASYAAIRVLEAITGRRAGGSTGTNLYGTLQIIAEMAARGEQGAVVTLLCDSGELYRDTYYNDAWLAANGHDIAPYLAQMRHFYETGVWQPLASVDPTCHPA
ncbi:PLP-dependent cysteine synthase family protein [Kallotenue papyrolyticum]|uniref:PLP-dependent cysteine synthase family protein n=1 Tax=Kallotenue papyrolyticum TaxID=1325125 RepID=UPI0004786157|nr:PLP-dependent cysteine synthase family protein [Kallotenue papyrolyticum]